MLDDFADGDSLEDPFVLGAEILGAETIMEDILQDQYKVSRSLSKLSFANQSRIAIEETNTSIGCND